MTDDLRLLILTHLRAALELRQWSRVLAAGNLLTGQGGAMADDLAAAWRGRSWRGVEAIYVTLGGIGAGVATLGPISGGSSRAEGQAA